MKVEQACSAHTLILAGGKGTRSENPSIPKILQNISENKTLLEIHLAGLLQSDLSQITLLLGYLHEPVINKIKELETDLSCKVNWEIDKEGDTPVTAIYKLIEQESDNDQIFTIILGDILVNVDFQIHIANLRKSHFLGTVLVHPNLHPSESDVFEFGANNVPKNLRLKGTGLSGNYPTRAIAGVYFLKRSSLALFNLEESDIAKGVLAPLFAARAIEVVNTFEYFQDTGTSSRLAKARKDFETGAFARRCEERKKCIFLDRDGTVIPNAGEMRREILNNEISANTIELISKANQNGIPIILITNQPGIAKGFITEADFLKTQYQLESILNQGSALLDDFIFCPHHPETGFEGEITTLKIVCDCRKPKTGMIDEMVKRHQIDVSGSIFIGDSDADKHAALSAGMKYLKVEPTELTLTDLSPILSDAIGKITS